MKTAVLGGAFAASVSTLFHDYGHPIVELPEAEQIVFVGGADVSPGLYGEENVASYCDPERDQFEENVYRDFDVPFIGICRGAQFLNVMNGGAMWQHVEAHPGTHVVCDVFSGSEFVVNSMHHQMMRPAPDGVVLATAREARSVMSANEVLTRPQDDFVEVEALYYPRTDSFCFQPHPEIEPETAEYFFHLLNQHRI